MLSERERLRRSADFTLAVRRGRRASRRSLVVHLYRGPCAGARKTGSGVNGSSTGDAPAARVGFVVPREVGGAVVRNRVKRRLRHVVRQRLERLPCGSLVVVRALPRSAQARFPDLAADFDAATTRLLGAGRGESGSMPGGAV